MRNEEDWFDVRPPVIDTHPPILGIGDEDGPALCSSLAAVTILAHSK